MLSKRNVKCGIPKGSILGLLVFLIYINDLPECLSQATFRLFADHTNLTVAGETIGEVELAMNDDLARTKHLARTKEWRVFGVDIDNKLKWNNHIDTVAKKVSSEIGAMRIIRDFVDKDTLISIYNAFYTRAG